MKQQPSYLGESYDDFGERCFTGRNAKVVLSKIFSSILSDPRIQSTCVIVDALDECTKDLELLLKLMQDLSAYPNVKWIVSSRNWPSIEKSLNKVTQKQTLRLELNEESVSEAVSIYIQSKANGLAMENDYGGEMRDIVWHHLLSNANGTFFWVALVCQELAKTSRWNTLSILAIVSTVDRPITLDELTALVTMPNGFSNDKSLTEIIQLCGSFLSLRNRTVSFFHQSAKDFLIEKAYHVVFTSGIEDEHHRIFTRSLEVMSRTLRCNVYNLRSPAFSIDQIKPPNPDPLAAARYSCVYWVDHLLIYNTRAYAADDLKDDGPVKKFLC